MAATAGGGVYGEYGGYPRRRRRGTTLVTGGAPGASTDALSSGGAVVGDHAGAEAAGRTDAGESAGRCGAGACDGLQRGQRHPDHRAETVSGASQAPWLRSDTTAGISHRLILPGAGLASWRVRTHTAHQLHTSCVSAAGAAQPALVTLRWCRRLSYATGLSRRQCPTLALTHALFCLPLSVSGDPAASTATTGATCRPAAVGDARATSAPVHPGGALHPTAPTGEPTSIRVSVVRRAVVVCIFWGQLVRQAPQRSNTRVPLPTRSQRRPDSTRRCLRWVGAWVVDRQRGLTLVCACVRRSKQKPCVRSECGVTSISTSTSTASAASKPWLEPEPLVANHALQLWTAATGCAMVTRTLHTHGGGSLHLSWAADLSRSRCAHAEWSWAAQHVQKRLGQTKGIIFAVSFGYTLTFVTGPGGGGTPTSAKYRRLSATARSTCTCTAATTAERCARRRRRRSGRRWWGRRWGGSGRI